MAKQHRVNSGTRFVNALFRQLTNLGLGAQYRRVLTVRGRKTGKYYSTPVDVMEHAGSWWLVAAYGPSNWVANARAASKVTLSRGGKSADYEVSEAAVADAVPVLRQYMQEVSGTRAYFDVSPEASDDEIAQELVRHPTLRLSQVA